MTKPKEVQLTATYFRLLDLGSPGYTSFDVDPSDMVDMYNEKPELMEQRAGLVHSHHNMDTFFSGTDTDELHEKAMNGLYLSLILNNDWEPIAKLAWGGEVERKIESKWNWSSIGQISNKTETEKMDVVYELDLNVVMQGEVHNTWEKFKELKKEKETKERTSFRGQRMLFGDNGYLMNAGRTFNGEVGAPGKQSDMFTDVNTPPLSDMIGADLLADAEVESSPFEDLSEAGYWEAVGGKIIMGNEDWDGETISQAITDFAQAVVKGNEDPDFTNNVKDAMFENIKNGKMILLNTMGSLFISKEDYEEVCRELLDELDSLQGRIADAMREGIEEYIDSITTKTSK